MRVLAPAPVVQDEVALGDPLRPRRHDLADGAAVQRPIELERRHVRLPVVHAAAHVRVHRHPEVADEDLSVPRLRHLDLRQAEVLVDGTATHLVRRRESSEELFAAEQIPVRQSRSS